MRSALCQTMCRRENEQPCTDKKGLPPSHHLIGKSHSITIDDVTCEGCGLFLMDLLNVIECHIENLKVEIGDRTPNCLRHQVWLDVSTFNKCLFTTKPRGFLLILICETSQIFVWRNKAFIFFQKSDIKSKCSKHQGFGPLLDAQMSFRVAGAMDCRSCRK